MAGGEVRSIARQPVMDENHRVQGYELSFDLGSNAPLRGGSLQAARTVLDDAVLFGIDRFTNGMTAFITCSAELLIENWVSVLTPAMTVLEVPASLPPTAPLVDVPLGTRV